VWGAGAVAVVAVLVTVLSVTHAGRRTRAIAPPSIAARSTDGQLPTLWPVPPFDFPGADGRVIGESALRGHVWIADFIFTRCVTMCPITTAKMSVLRRSIPSADVRFVSFSVDPEFDTPRVLQAYAARWSADPRWLLLSPPPAEVNEFAKAMNVPFEHTAMPLEPILHTTLFFLIDRRGRVRGLYGSLDDAAVLRLVADATRLDAEAEPAGQSGPRPNAERPGVSGASRGGALFQVLGCGACHADPKTGPPLAGLPGRTVRLEGGVTVSADDAYLRRSILAPAEQVVSGYNPLMPAYRAYLTDADVDDLVAFLRVLPAARGAESRAPARQGGELAGAAGEDADTGEGAGADIEAQDPVCGMTIKRAHAAAHADYGGKTYYFCSDRCLDRFVRDPARYAR
jgi:protein SCO1